MYLALRHFLKKKKKMMVKESRGEGQDINQNRDLKEHKTQTCVCARVSCRNLCIVRMNTCAKICTRHHSEATFLYT